MATIIEAAKQQADRFPYHSKDYQAGIEEGYMMGALWMVQKCRDVLDGMFMDEAEITVDDWFRDSSNLFQGREVFMKKVME